MKYFSENRTVIFITVILAPFLILSWLNGHTPHASELVGTYQSDQAVWQSERKVVVVLNQDGTFDLRDRTYRNLGKWRLEGHNVILVTLQWTDGGKLEEAPSNVSQTYLEVMPFGKLRFPEDDRAVLEPIILSKVK